MMSFKTIVVDKRLNSLTRLEFMRYLVENYGLDKAKALEFSRRPEVEYEYLVMDLMGNYIDINDIDIKNIITKGVELGYLTE